MPSKKPQLKIRLSHETRETLQVLCEMHDTTQSQLIAQLVRAAGRREGITTKNRTCRNPLCVVTDCCSCPRESAPLPLLRA